MEAKETVDKFLEEMGWVMGKDGMQYAWLLHLVEISFKAGIKEVVGLLDKPCPHTSGIEEQQMRAIDCPKCWQAQLKEWGDL